MVETTEGESPEKAKMASPVTSTPSDKENEGTGARPKLATRRPILPDFMESINEETASTVILQDTVVGPSPFHRVRGIIRSVPGMRHIDTPGCFTPMSETVNESTLALTNESETTFHTALSVIREEDERSKKAEKSKKNAK